MCALCVVNLCYHCFQVKEFIETFQASRSFYGYIEDTTLASLMLSLLPTSSVYYKEMGLTEASDGIDMSTMSNRHFILSTLLKNLKNYGFHFSIVSEAFNSFISFVSSSFYHFRFPKKKTWILKAYLTLLKRMNSLKDLLRTEIDVILLVE